MELCCTEAWWAEKGGGRAGHMAEAQLQADQAVWASPARVG
jgi:hypothetical protein